MATLIPDPISGKSTPGERELARLLRRLPDDWIVYFEPRIGGLRPDFVILAPELGVLVIEVKDWQMRSITSMDAESVELRSKKHPNPLQQVDGYWRAVKDACQSSLFGQALIAKDEKWRGRLCFPVGTAVLFTRISEADVERSDHGAAWEAIFTKDNTVLADERRTWENLEEDELASVLKRFFRPFAMRERFTAHQIDVLRWVLFPESRMDVILGGERADQNKVLQVLDARQESHARSLGSGHRVLFGVAGSGKTILLLARARWLARERPDQRTLLLCYNKVLATWLSARVADCSQLTVRHFDGWAKDQGVARNWGEEDGVFGERFLAAMQERGEAARNWDAMLIDEAQDFEPSWFRCALAGIKDPEDGDVVIVADGSQRLYKRSRLSWKELGIKAVGRTISARYDLDRNYRNTPRIAALAEGYSTDEPEADGIGSRRVGPNMCRRFNHSTPTFVDTMDRGQQVDAALEIVGRWLRGERGGGSFPPLKPEDIGIFYPKLVDRPQLERLIAGLSQMAPTRWLSKPRDRDAHSGVNEAAIKVQTVHSAKGLQYKAVIVLWTDCLPFHLENEELEKHLLYVAITRAEDDLVLLGSGGRGFAGNLKTGCPVRSYPFDDNIDPPAVA
ncbi:MAG: hypothetical protein ACI9R3_005315 [Verrucomicrobiales bacterium]|jgi:hypothetical protein